MSRREGTRRVQRTLIGWREWAGLPDLGVAAVKAKVDTGARSSALHAHDLLAYHRGGRQFVSFEVHPLQRGSAGAVRARAEVVDMRSVRSSSGQVELRPVIRTRLALAGQEFEIELTLTRRDEMGFRMLLGREALRRMFLVHPGRSFLLGKPPS